jgi:hypothetical protein
MAYVNGQVMSGVDWGEGFIFNRDYQELNKEIVDEYSAVMLRKLKSFFVQYDYKGLVTSISQLLVHYLSRFVSVFRTAKRVE